MTKEEKQKGIILYIVLLIMSVFIAIVLTLTSVSISQIKIAWQAGDSVKAFTAADNGVERALYKIRRELNEEDFKDYERTISISETLLNNSSYIVNITYTKTKATIISKGVFGKTRRTIEAKY